MKQTIHKAYKFRLYPNKNQKIIINKSVGSCRFIYNYFLDYKTKYYTQHKNDKKKSISFVETEYFLTLLKKEEEYIWLKEVNSQSLQFALRNLDSAYSRFFKKLGNFPKFKKKRNGGSFTIPQFFKIVEEGNKFSFVKLPKIKQPFKFRLSKQIEGKILYCTISKTPTNKFFISFTTKQEIMVKENKRKKAVGIDVGIKSLVVTSDNKIFETNNKFKKKEKRLKRIQRKHSKAKKVGDNKNKLRKKLALQHEKIKNSRNDYLHKISSYLVKNQDIIITEDLNVSGMLKNHCLAKSLSNQAFRELFKQLKYKSEWNNKIYYKIDRWFPSSQICNYCGSQNKQLKLSDRTWICSNCNKEINRDYNAANNIKDLELKDLCIITIGTTESYASGRTKITEDKKLFSVSSSEGRIPQLKQRVVQY